MNLRGILPRTRDSLTLGGDGVHLRPPRMGDFPEWVELRSESREFLAPWEPLWAPDELTRSGFRHRLRQYRRDRNNGLAHPFFVFRDGDNALIGGCTLSDIHHGVRQSCSLGYWVGAPHAHQGYITAAVRVLIPFAFNHLHLERIEAACIPDNIASQKVLLKCGFSPEGTARQFLRIAGTRHDHLRFAILRGDANS